MMGNPESIRLQRSSTLIVFWEPKWEPSVLENGSVSTSIYLRRIHNFALDMSWLPWPVLPKRRWHEIKFREKRAIRWEEHQLIVEREQNAERKAFYQLAWHLGSGPIGSRVPGGREHRLAEQRHQLREKEDGIYRHHALR